MVKKTVRPKHLSIVRFRATDEMAAKLECAAVKSGKTKSEVARSLLMAALDELLPECDRAAYRSQGRRVWG